MHYYQHNIKTWNSATRHLTRVEQSLYRCCIELYYDTESPLKNDIARLERLTMCANPEEGIALSYVLESFFELIDGFWHHAYCDNVISEYRRLLASKSNAGKASAAARLSKITSKNEHNSTTVQHPFNDCSTNNKPLTINHKPLTNTKDLVSPEAQQSKNGSRLPVDWILPDDWMGDAKEIGLSIFDALNESIIFRDYWIGVAGAKGRKADWRATWRNWVRRKAQDRNNQPKPTQSHQDNFIDKHTDASWADGVSSDWRGNPL